MKEETAISVVLIGNPNTGKTSLLNSLTGMSLHVGNWPGKTVEKKEGRLQFKGREIRIVDLPGSYSIAPYSEEEKVTHAFLMTGEADVIVETMDVNALERNLLMTMELLALGKKLVLAFNFNQEARRRGIDIEAEKIGAALRLPVIKIEANRGENTDRLLEEVIRLSGQELTTPDYLPALLKESGEIHHDEAVRFFRESLGPYYHTEKADRRTERIDAFLLNKFTAFPVFLAVVFLMFTATFTISQPLVNAIDGLFAWLGRLVELLRLPSFLNSLLADGVIGGVGSILSFAPLIFVLFLLIAILEDSGYLGRTVVLMDRLFRMFGISGRCFIPMILGFGCNVPAIMATRTIKDPRERTIAILTNSFMSCGARLPVYVLFTRAFFSHQAIYVIMALYTFGIVTAFAASWVLSRLIRDTERHALIIELPPYRMPTALNMLKHAWYHTKEFMKKAGTIIFGAVLVIWILASLPAGVSFGSEASLLGRVGRTIAPAFGPLGFGHWTFAVALIFGIVAKEVILGTLGTLYSVGNTGLSAAIAGRLSPAAGLAFLFFVLLYVPCLATIAVMRKETGSWKLTLLQPAFTILVAWAVAFGVYNLAWWLGWH